jgi:very-short-patch-repair endonuclease
MANKRANSEADRAISAIAARRHGIVTRTQLLAAGILPSGITDRIKAGRLHRIHRGVYALGHAGLSAEGRWLAAVLACGDGAVLSHRSAAALWRMIASAPNLSDVTVPTGSGRRAQRRIRLHRSRTLLPSHTTLRMGIPVTRPARTLQDLRRIAPASEFAAALRQAEYLRLPLEDRLEPDHTRSQLETAFLRLCRRHRLPSPEVNVRVGPYLVDFLWRTQRLIVETDGYRAHGTRTAFERDRARDTDLLLSSYVIVRLTQRQITQRPAAVAASIRSLLSRGGA